MNQNLLLSNAINLYAAGQLDEAEKAFRQVLNLSPALPQALYFLGLIALSKGIFDEACQLLYQSTLADPKNKDFQYSLAVALQESGKLNEALAIYEKIADMPESQNNMGNIYRQMGQLDKSRTAFDKAIQINPDMVLAYVNKALLERQQNNLNQAENLLAEALKIDPNSVQALYQTSVQNRLNNNINSSLQYIEKAIKIANNIDFLFVEYGKVLNLLGQKNDALAAFEKAIAVNRFCTDAYFEKAMLLENENPDLAEQAYRDVLRTDVNNVAAYNNLGALLYRQNRVMEALEMYRNVFIIDPTDTKAAFNLAIALEDLGNFEEAAGLYFKVLGQKQLQSIIHLRLANMLPKWFETDPKTALLYASGWVKNFPDNPLAIHTNNALNGQSSETDIDFAYTQTFYDAFADTYDEKMQILNCQIPQLIAQKTSGKTFENVLDLGCGTGLSGALLRTGSKHLTGVDMSQKMIQKAEKKHIYDALFTMDILDYLQTTSQAFDLIVAADVFCYINKLDDIIKEAHKDLTSRGTFIFTVEKAPNPDQIILQPNGRYQHGFDIINSALKNAGFAEITAQEVTLRQENKAPCQGYLFMAQKA